MFLAQYSRLGQPERNSKQEDMIAEYKFDGTYLRDRRGNRLGAIEGRYIKDSRGNRLGEIDGKYIKDSRGSRLAEIDGREIRDARGSRICTVEEIKKSIDGVGGASLAAVWLFFVR